MREEKKNHMLSININTAKSMLQVLVVICNYITLVAEMKGSNFAHWNPLAP